MLSCSDGRRTVPVIVEGSKVTVGFSENIPFEEGVAPSGMG